MLTYQLCSAALMRHDTLNKSVGSFILQFKLITAPVTQTVVGKL